MSLLDNVMEWPYKNKGKTALILGPLAGPLTHAYQHFSFVMQGQDYAVDPDKLVQQYVTQGVFGILGVHIWLTVLGRIKPPRLRNFAAAVGSSFEGLVAGFSPDAETRRANLAETLRVLEDPNPNLSEAADASFLVSRGEYGAALEKRANYLETNRGRRHNPTDMITAPFVAAILGARSFVRRDTQSQLEECFFHLESGSDDYMANVLWPRILDQHPGNLELQLLRALMVSQSKLTYTAQASWQYILETNLDRLRKIAESRNEVVEIDANTYVRGVVVIKKGGGLEREYNILLHLRANTPVEPQITVMPIAHYRTGQQEILITKRRPGHNLERLLRADRSNVQRETVSALKAIAHIHDCPPPKTPIEQYNPLQEVQRRLFSRFGYTTKAERLETALRVEWERRAVDGTTLIHGDFYPTNVLEGGLVLDFEKASYGDSTFDVENFIGAPELDGIDEDGAIRAYQEQRGKGALANRDLWRVHSAICQVGSFHAKGDLVGRAYFATRAVITMEQASLREPLTRFLAYMEQAKVSL